MVLGGGSYAIWFYFGVPANDFTYDTKTILKSAESFELLSLNPYRIPSEDISKRESFHDYVVLGKTELDPQTRDELLASLERGIGNSKHDYASCYWPRHGIHARLKDKTVDLQICFECGFVYIFTDEKVRCIHTDYTPLAQFNQALSHRGIPMTKE